MEERLRIKVNINGTSLQLDINADDEEVYRKAAKVLNDRVVEYKANFETCSMETILKMVAFEMAVEAVKMENNAHSAPLSKIEELTELMRKRAEE